MAKSFSLEAFKFSVYLSIPIAMTVFFAMNPSNLEDIIRQRMYVVYPASAPDPPSDAEMKRIVEQNRMKSNNDNKNKKGGGGGGGGGGERRRGKWFGFSASDASK
jgi:protein PET100